MLNVKDQNKNKWIYLPSTIFFSFFLMQGNLFNWHLPSLWHPAILSPSLSHLVLHIWEGNTCNHCSASTGLLDFIMAISIHYGYRCKHTIGTQWRDILRLSLMSESVSHLLNKGMGDLYRCYASTNNASEDHFSFFINLLSDEDKKYICRQFSLEITSAPRNESPSATFWGHWDRTYKIMFRDTFPPVKMISFCVLLPNLCSSPLPTVE